MRLYSNDISQHVEKSGARVGRSTLSGLIVYQRIAGDIAAYQRQPRLVAKKHLLVVLKSSKQAAKPTYARRIR
jgi:hypothetical protein